MDFRIGDKVIRRGCARVFIVTGIGVGPEVPSNNEVVYLIETTLPSETGQWVWIAEVTLYERDTKVIEAPEIDQDYLVYRE